jgi:hypothetical protein
MPKVPPEHARNWGIKKECLIEKGLQMTTLDFCYNCSALLCQ